MLLMPLGAWAQSEYGLTIAGIPVTSQNAGGIIGDNISGIVTYNADQHALTLEGATIAGSIVVTNENNLTINVIGANSISSGTSSALTSEAGGIPGPYITFVKAGDGDCSLELHSNVTVISTHFGGFYYTDLALVTDVENPSYDYQFSGLCYYDSQSQSTLPVTSATITSYTTYDLIISGEQVTNINMNAICSGTVGDGHITFDGEHTLTFNNVPSMVFDGSNVPGFIQTSMDLTINIVGNSYFDCGNSVFITRLPGDNETHTVTFTTDATDPGMLTLQVGNQFDGFEKAFENNLSWMPAGYYDTTDPNGPAAWVAQPFALDGEGTAESPYLIKTANDLKTFSNYVNNGFITTENVKLENDINCSTLTGFVPIGSNTPFIGTFEGNNKTISGLTYISESADDIVGLFAVVGTEGGPTGSIYNLVLEDCSFGGGYINGGIVGLMNSGTIQICKVTGNSTISAAVGANNVAGAIVGSNSQGALVGNYYYYSVTTSTQVSSAEEAVVKSGYEERGIGDSDDITADDGAMLYTKQLTITGLGDNCANEGDPGYGPLADYDNFIFHYAPTANVLLYLYPNEGFVPSVTLSYIETGETEPTVVPLEKDPNEDGYVYSFTMPDVNATFAIALSNSYPLYIGDTQVTDANADDVLGDGKVSFTVSGGQEAAPTYTLTLNGAALTQPIKVGLANLTFDIQGTNSITTDETCIQKMDNTTPAVTFTSNSDVVGTLTLKNTSDDLTGVNNIGEYGVGSFSISDQFALVLKRYGYIYSNQYYFTDGSTLEAKLSPSYGVTVGGMQICADNAADVTGDGIGGGDDSGMVSFDKDNSILTLNNASLSGIIRSSLPNLTIELVGDNSIYSGGDRILQAGVAVNMTIQSSADVKGLLSMHKGYSSSEKGNFVDDNVTLTISAPLAVISGSLTDDVAKNDYYATIGVNYGITINTATAGIVITSQNRKNVLEDDEATVQFDGRNTLILNGANIAGIVIGATTPLNTTDGLTVHLTGNNTITNGTKAIANEGNAMPLTLTTSDVEQGELEYICTTCTLTVANSAFSGFTPIKYNDNLAASLDAEANPQVVTIVAVMEPFVTSSGETNTEDGNGIGLGKDLEQVVQGLSAEAATTLLGEGVIVNKILYTLPNNDDGYIDDHDYVTVNGKVVALNTPMDDGEVNDILEYIKNGLIQPGTKLGDPYTFAYYFHGMSFLLPAGYGEISLDVNTNEAGVLHVKVGSNEPVSITGTKDPEGEIGFETIKIPYALTEESYVFIYRYAPSTSSRDDDHRAPGRKETTTTGIRGLSVNGSSVESSPEPPLSPKKLDKSLVVKTGNHVTVVDPDVEGIESDAFDELSGDITYVDLRQTSITGMAVNRMIVDEDLFKKLPEKTFIYLPAGNIVTTGTKNVVVGSVCKDMEMKDDETPFEVSSDFVAVKAVHARDFSEMLNKRCTIYLPFALNEEQASSLGTFYEMTGIAEGKIMFTSVKETKANMPYMFKPAKETVSAQIVEVKATIPEAPVIGSATFEGTYDQKTILSDASTQYYCFKADDGKLVHVIDNSMKVDPFRCYIKVTGAASLGRFLEIVTDDEVTAIKNIKVGTENNVYYDLSGRRVLYPKKGIYIVNGKKVILK